MQKVNGFAAPDLDGIVFTADQIQARVAELGARISADYQDREVILLAILKGALPFLADLARHITCQVLIDFMVVSRVRRGGGQGEVRIVKDLDLPLAGRHVLLVEDIVDEGETLAYLMDSLSLRDPASLKVVTLFEKPERRKGTHPPDYTGFQVPERFVVGYGLDFHEKYRNLPYLATLRPQALATPEGAG